MQFFNMWSRFLPELARVLGSSRDVGRLPETSVNECDEDDYVVMA